MRTCAWFRISFFDMIVAPHTARRRNLECDDKSRAVRGSRYRFRSALCAEPLLVRTLSRIHLVATLNRLRQRRSARTKCTRRSAAGQAAVEFIASLLLVLLVLTGIIHVARLARTSLFLHAVLRGDTGRRAMRGGVLARAPTHISDWSPGADDIRHTADDQPVRNGLAVLNAAQTLTDLSVRSDSDWTFVAQDSRLPLSMIRLRDSPNSATIVGFVHGEETLHVPVDHVLRELVYDKDDVAIKEEVWMPLMGGLY